MYFIYLIYIKLKGLIFAYDEVVRGLHQLTNRFLTLEEKQDLGILSGGLMILTIDSPEND